MNESFQEPTVEQLAMQIEEAGLTAAVAPLRAHVALDDAPSSDVAWLRAYVSARTRTGLRTGLRTGWAVAA
jgi:hypothetical protein